jgi:serine/threonine-protein kinase 11
MVKQYILGEVLGEGSFGKVREAVDSKTGRRCAIKILKRRNLRKVPDGEELVNREIEILKKVHHSNCISLVGSFTDEERDKIYIVCEYVSGCSLQRLLEKAPEKRLPLTQARSIFKQLINALEYLHSIGIVHSDVKPDNILLTVDGVVKLSDFGVAQCDEAKSSARNGAPAFQAPEIASDKGSGSSNDIWAAGITLYIMVVGKFPFEGTNVVSLFESIGSGFFSIPDWVDESLVDLIRSMLQVDHTKRITIQQIKNHPWMSAKLKQEPPVVIPPNPTSFSGASSSKHILPSCSCSCIIT